MARLHITDFSLNLIPGGRVRMELAFDVILTPTESRLRIPSRVYVRLMERDYDRDRIHLFADEMDFRPASQNDDPATGWVYVNTFSTSTSSDFSMVLNRSSLPGEPGREEWYAVMVSRPDIISDVEYSSEIGASLAT